MFEKQFREKIKGVLRNLRKMHAHHQKKEIKNLRAVIHNIMEFDRLVQELSSKRPLVLNRLESLDKNFCDEYYQMLYNLLERVVQFVEMEDQNIDDLNDQLRQKNRQGIDEKRQQALWLPKIETSYLQRVEVSVARMMELVEHIKNQTPKEDRVSSRLLSILHQLLRDTKKRIMLIINYLRHEERAIEAAKRPVQV